MASNFTLDLAGVEKIEGTREGEVQFGSSGWRVRFRVETPRAGYDVATFVAASCPGEKVVREAKHRFHLQMAALAEQTAGWRLPEA